MVNWKKIVFSSHWKTTQQRVMSLTCERFCQCSSKKGEHAAILQIYIILVVLIQALVVLVLILSVFELVALALVFAVLLPIIQ